MTLDRARQSINVIVCVIVAAIIIIIIVITIVVIIVNLCCCSSCCYCLINLIVVIIICVIAVIIVRIVVIVVVISSVRECSNLCCEYSEFTSVSFIHSFILFVSSVCEGTLIHRTSYIIHHNNVIIQCHEDAVVLIDWMRTHTHTHTQELMDLKTCVHTLISIRINDVICYY